LGLWHIDQSMNPGPVSVYRQFLGTRERGGRSSGDGNDDVVSHGHVFQNSLAEGAFRRSLRLQYRGTSGLPIELGSDLEDTWVAAEAVVGVVEQRIADRYVGLNVAQKIIGGVGIVDGSTGYELVTTDGLRLEL
jgi:hypothetical protein